MEPTPAAKPPATGPIRSPLSRQMALAKWTLEPSRGKRKNVTTNTYKPSTVSESQAKVAKAAAHAACQKVVEVTDLVEFKTPPTSDSLSLPSVEETELGTI